MEVSGNIGKFLDAKGVVQQAAEQAKKESEENFDPSKVNSQALNNVMMEMQLANAEKELREMLVYETPGLGDIWTRFGAERERLWGLQQQHQEELDRQAKRAREQALQKAARRRRQLEQIWHDAHWVITVLAIVAVYAGSMYMIVEDRKVQTPELGTCFIPRGAPGYEWYSSSAHGASAPRRLQRATWWGLLFDRSPIETARFIEEFLAGACRCDSIINMSLTHGVDYDQDSDRTHTSRSGPTL